MSISTSNSGGAGCASASSGKKAKPPADPDALKIVKISENTKLKLHPRAEERARAVADGSYARPVPGTTTDYKVSGYYGG